MSEENIGDRIASDYFEETSGAYESLSSSINVELAALRATLAEKEKEIEQLKEHACEYSAVDKIIINPCGYVMGLLERAEKAELMVKQLQEKLNEK